MMDDDAIPTSYEQWRHCIEVLGKIRLTQEFIDQRLAELRDDSHPRTKEYVRVYGTDLLNQTINWFRRAADEVPVHAERRTHA